MTLQDIGIDEYYEYSTTNILVMELIAESVTGKSMKELVSKVTSELGLSNTALPLRKIPSREYFQVSTGIPALNVCAT